MKTAKAVPFSDAPMQVERIDNERTDRRRGCDLGCGRGQVKGVEVGEKCARQEAGANEATESGKRDGGRLLILNAQASVD
ncbi:hypothetical protein J1614_008477 [Plenodomus biglobosus]|nr:hypothetical protein J1614_008477 [Plenodomus biglobosus]